jgi:DDE superfamily endonuclease
MNRRYGRIEGGERVNDEQPGNKGKNISLVGAMSDEGLIAAMTLPGGFNTASFLVYIEQILLPALWVGAIVVMDNVPLPYGGYAYIMLIRLSL